MTFCIFSIKNANIDIIKQYDIIFFELRIYFIRTLVPGVTITVGGLPFFREGVRFCPLSFHKEGDKMYLTVTELFLFVSLLISLISLFVTIYNHKK